MNAMERVRRRLALMLDERTHAGKLRQKALVRHCGKSAAWISNILAGRKGLRLVDLDLVADFFRIPPSELVRETDSDLVEVSPSELALLRKLRRSSDKFKEGIYMFAGLELAAQDARAKFKPPQKRRRKGSVYKGLKIVRDANPDINKHEP